MDSYQLLTNKLLQKLKSHEKFSSACIQLGINESRFENWTVGKTQIRLSTYLTLLQKLGFRAVDIMTIAVMPLSISSKSSKVTNLQFDRNIIAPILKILRGPRTLQAITKMIKVKSTASYAHWESGRRAVSLPCFLQILDHTSQRLPDFCEAIGIQFSPIEYGLSEKGRISDFPTLFFGNPWTPTVYLAIVAKLIQPGHPKLAKNWCQSVGISEEQLFASLKTLFDLRLLRQEKGQYFIRKEYFYAPPTLCPQVVNNLNQFWFTKSLALKEANGYHKIDQLTFSKESLSKIETWVGELRDRIRKESKYGPPETILHFHWQITDLGIA